jgi:hypothetical protein
MPEEAPVETGGEINTPAAGEATAPENDVPVEETTGEATAPEATVEPGEETLGEGEATAPTQPQSKDAEGRIKDLVHEKKIANKKLYAVESQLDALKEENQRLKESQKPPPAPPRPKPVWDDFDGDQEAYAQAVSDHNADIAKANAAIKQAEESQKQREAEAVKDFNEKVNNVVDKGRKLYADFDDIALGDMALRNHVQVAIANSEKGAEMLYHLGSNPELSLKLSRMTPTAALVEIGRIESTLKTPTAKVSTAPPPVTPVGGNAPVPKDYLTDPNISDHDWQVQRDAEVAAKKAAGTY